MKVKKRNRTSEKKGNRKTDKSKENMNEKISSYKFREALVCHIFDSFTLFVNNAKPTLIHYIFVWV